MKQKMAAYLLSLAIGICGLMANSFALSPWFTGPLLAPAGHTLPKGHQNYEPYLFFTDNIGVYNNHWHSQHVPESRTLSPTMVFTQGVTNRIDVQLIAPYNFNNHEGENDSNLGDISAVIGYQLLNEKSGSLMPDLRVTLQEGFPTGKYKNLDASKAGTDATGSGSFQTSFGLNFQKMFQVMPAHALRTRLSFTYTIPSSVHVTGVNSYGGVSGTDGHVKPGKKFATDLGFEYQLTQHWVPALDVTYSYTTQSSFSGTAGTISGLPAEVGSPRGEQVSVAPALEYNFNSHLGIIGGAWFTVAGKNSARFSGGAIAVNYYV